MTSAKGDDVRKVVNTAIDQVRTPLLAALGAGNLASQALADALAKAKERVAEGGEAARKNIEELPGEVDHLRERLDPAELRKLIDEYTESALRLYNRLAESGEQTWERIAAQPQVKKAIEQLHTAQDRVEGVTGDVLGRVSRRTRSAGEKAAQTVSDAAVDVAGKVEEAGGELAGETRSASRKAADRTDKAAPRATSTARRSTSSTTTSAEKPAEDPKSTK
jgi:heparin binding hemagglutinin HbhA